MKHIVVASVVLLLASPAAADSIKGVVKLTGKPPKREPLAMSTAPNCPQDDAGQFDETVVTDGKGGLRDVHVRIKSGTAGAHAAPKTPITIDQKGCMYRPRVVGAIAGQVVQVQNSDPLMHNVHTYRGKQSDTNRAQPQGAKPIALKKLGDAGSVFTLKCDVHSWMISHVAITDHPYFAVTGDDGSFTIDNVPKGKSFTLEAWHPRYGLKSQTVKAGASKVVFEYP